MLVIHGSGDLHFVVCGAPLGVIVALLMRDSFDGFQVVTPRLEIRVVVVGSSRVRNGLGRRRYARIRLTAIPYFKYNFKHPTIDDPWC